MAYRLTTIGNTSSAATSAATTELLNDPNITSAFVQTSYPSVNVVFWNIDGSLTGDDVAQLLLTLGYLVTGAWDAQI